MPFRTSATNPAEPQVSLKTVTTRTFRLGTSFDYVDPVADVDVVRHVPSHKPPATTDLASVPPLL